MVAVLANASTAGSVDDDVIERAERTLGVVFPPSYRFFLKKFGAAFGRGYEVAGLFAHARPDRPPMWTDVVKATLRLREASRGEIPAGYIAVSGDGGDLTYYIDTTRRDLSGECPIVALGPGADDLVIAPTFASFVVQAAEDV